MTVACAFDAPPPGGDRSASPAKFRLTFTDERFKWAGETRPGVPLLRWPSGAICEPVLLHFGRAAASGRIACGSMRVEAHVLRAWLAFLWQRGVRWDQADDGLLRAWREEQREAVRRERQRGRQVASAQKGNRMRLPSITQVERKMAVVFAFYDGLPVAVRPLPTRGAAAAAAFVGPDGSGLAITSKEAPAAVFRGDVAGTCWEGAQRVPKKRVRREPLEAVNVARLLAQVRDRPAAAPTRRPTRSAASSSEMEGERDWLVARCEAEAGLRAEEVAHLSLLALAAALVEEGIGPGSAVLRGAPDALATAGLDAAVREGVLSGLDRLAGARREVLGIEVTCKGRTRRAPFPIGLMRDVLDIGVWTVRAAQVLGRDPRRSSPLVFLSGKTGRGLLPASVVDLMGDAFDRLGLTGGGHRLRARFATDVAFRLVEARMALNGYVYDRTVETWALEQVREALGHASIDTTVRHYVDRALMRLLHAPTKAALKGVLEAHRALSLHGRALSACDLGLVREVIERLARDRDADRVRGYLQSAVAGTTGEGGA